MPTFANPPHNSDMSQNRFDISTTLARAVVDAVREPFLVLDQDLRIIAASRSFYTNFQIGQEKTQGQMLYDLDDGQWNIAALRLLLDRGRGGTTTGGGSGHRSGGGHAPLLFQQLRELGRLNDGQGREFVHQLREIGHRLSPNEIEVLV